MNFEDGKLDFEHDSLRLGIIKNWVLNTKLLLSGEEIASKHCSWLGQVPQDPGCLAHSQGLIEY